MKTITEIYDRFIDKLGMPEERLGSLLREDRGQKITSFLVAFFGGIILYAPTILKWLPHQDGIYYGIYYRALSSYAVENSGGRFGNTFLAHLKGLFIFPAFDVILSAFFLALAVTLIINHFQIKDKISNVILSLLLVASPCFFTTITYYYCTDAYFFALLLSVIAFYIMNKKKNIWRLIVSGSIMAIVLSIYQVYIFITASLCIMDMILLMMENQTKLKQILKNAVWYILCAGIGAFFYFVSFLYIQKIWCVQAFSAHGFDASKKVTGNEILTQILQPYKDFFAYYFGGNFTHNGISRALLNVIVILTFLWISIRFLKDKQNGKPKRVLFLACILILPFVFQGVSVLSARAPIYILMFPTAGLLYVLTIALMDRTPNNKGLYLGKRITCTILTIICFTLFVEACQYQSGRNRNIMSAYGTATEVARQIEKVPNNREYSIIVVGTTNESEIVYNGTFAETLGWLSYMRQYIGLDYNMSEEGAMNSVIDTDQFKQMPMFPEEGFVNVIDGNIVVKISEPR